LSVYFIAVFRIVSSLLLLLLAFVLLRARVFVVCVCVFGEKSIRKSYPFLIMYVSSATFYSLLKSQDDVVVGHQ